MFKIGDRVKTRSFNGDPVRHDLTGTVAKCGSGLGFTVVIDPECNYSYPKVSRRESECELIPRAEADLKSALTAAEAEVERLKTEISRINMPKVGTVEGHHEIMAVIPWRGGFMTVRQFVGEHLNDRDIPTLRNWYDGKYQEWKSGR